MTHFQMSEFTSASAAGHSLTFLYVCSHVTKARGRLQQRKQELEDIITEMEARIEEEEHHAVQLNSDKKKLQIVIQDLEEQ